jgi:hypothetical protein
VLSNTDWVFATQYFRHAIGGIMLIMTLIIIIIIVSFREELAIENVHKSTNLLTLQLE